MRTQGTYRYSTGAALLAPGFGVRASRLAALIRFSTSARVSRPSARLRPQRLAAMKGRAMPVNRAIRIVMGASTMIKLGPSMASGLLSGSVARARGLSRAWASQEIWHGFLPGRMTPPGSRIGHVSCHREVRSWDLLPSGSYRLGDLAEAAVGAHHDPPGGASVLGFVALPAGQAEADPLGDDVGQRRAGEHRDPEEPGDGVEVQVEVVGNLVVGRGGPQHPVEGDPGGAEAGAGGRVAGAVKDVVRVLAAGEPAVKQRVGRQQGEERTGQKERGHQDREDERMPGDRQLPGRHEPQRAVEES